MVAITAIAAVLAIIALFATITLGVFCLKCCLPKRGTKASSANLKFDLVTNKAGAPKVINTQPEPSNEGMKEPRDEEALLSSTTTDLPTTPVMVYDPNNASRFPEPQEDLHARGVTSRDYLGEYEGFENTPMLANMRALSLPRQQGHSSVLPTFPEPRYDQYSRTVPQDSFGQSRGTGNSLRQTNMKVSPPQRPSDLPTLPEPQGEPYPASGSLLAMGGPSTLPEAQDEAYSPSVSPQAIFGQSRGTGNTPANIRGSQPLGYNGLPIV